MTAAAVDYVAAGSYDEVRAALADGDASVLAGGQSLVHDLARRTALPRRLVDINRVTELATLTETDGVLRVGPLVRHRVFESSAVGGALGDLLRLVVRNIGHPPVRARGTMLGSLAYAHPAAEWPVMAVTVGADIDLTGPDGTRTVAAERFFTGPFTTVRRPEELLAEVRLPVLPAGTGTGYAEDRRGPGIYPEAAVLAAVTVVDDVITAAAIGLVNAGPCPIRARQAERVLIGTSFSDSAIIAAADAAVRLDAEFAPHALRALTRRALTQAREGT
ncbi:FAD binding domain-containing protein [Paractinoplanes toevensis]|uniref:Carbon monoxide dehydrogenase n=1 Tax=Paractinoplanes toevensis TaxID=571911 RepID=A0A919TBF6_9ACTN|nr:FAD binding domain-containing protein [Actinoplanes toevensis]GIM91139.1 carbon monoxide dehydrogenase [Actinoplanes toevensis]